MLIDDQTETVAFLSRPEAFGLKSSSPVVVKETNISYVFLTGDKAYKLKKGVKFPYTDYSDFEKRRASCLREQDLDERFSPGLCLGVEDIVSDKNGRLHLASRYDGTDATPVDSVLIMHRFSEDMLFDNMVERGDLDRFEMMDTAEKIYSLQQAAPVVNDRDAYEIILGRIRENNAMIRCFVPDTFDAEDVDELEQLQMQALESVKDLLEKRRANGNIRWCHGDLTLRNIAMRDGKVTLLNPIEFYDDLTKIDTLYDFAFLLVDMESRGQRRLASILFNHYMALSADWDGVPLLPLYLSCRAAINAYVFAERAAAITDRREAALMANRAFEQLVIARRYFVQNKPVIVACGGLSGSGKSRIGREAAPFIGNPPGAVILRDDVLRKNILNVGLNEYIDTAEYTDDLEKKVFDLLCDKCADFIKAGRSVVVDALFHNESQRRKIEDLAGALNVDFQGLWVDAPLEVRIQRVASRQRNPSDVKKPEELRQQLDVDIGYVGWDKIDTSGDRMSTLTKVRTLLEKYN